MGKGGGCVPSKKKAPQVPDDSPTSAARPSRSAPIPLDESATAETSANAASSTQETESSIVAAAAARLKVFIVFYSMYDHVEGLARRVKKGVDGVEGVEGVLYRVPDTLPAEVLSRMKAPEKDDSIPEITAEELADADGVLFGFPTQCESVLQAAKCERDV